MVYIYLSIDIPHKNVKERPTDAMPHLKQKERLKCSLTSFEWYIWPRSHCGTSNKTKWWLYFIVYFSFRLMGLPTLNIFLQDRRRWSGLSVTHTMLTTVSKISYDANFLIKGIHHQMALWLLISTQMHTCWFHLIKE